MVKTINYQCTNCKYVYLSNYEECPNCGNSGNILVPIENPTEPIDFHIFKIYSLKGFVTDMEREERDDQNTIKEYINNKKYHELLIYYQDNLERWKLYISSSEEIIKVYNPFFSDMAFPLAFSSERKKGAHLLMVCVLALMLCHGFYKFAKKRENIEQKRHNDLSIALKNILVDKGLIGANVRVHDIFSEKNYQFQMNVGRNQISANKFYFVGLINIIFTCMGKFYDSLTMDEKSILLEYPGIMNFTQSLSNHRFENIENEIETLIRDPRFPKAGELERICNESFMKFADASYDNKDFKDRLSEIIQTLEKKKKFLSPTFKTLSNFVKICDELRKYQHFDKELIEQTCNIDSSEYSLEALSLKLETAKALLENFKRKESEEIYIKTRDDTILICRSLNEQVLACRSHDVKREYQVVKDLLTKTKTEAELIKINKRLDSIKLYTEEEKEILENLHQSMQNIKAWIEEMPDDLKKKHEINEKFEHAAISLQTQGLSELKDEIYELEYLVPLLIKILNKCEKVTQRIEDSESVLGKYNMKAYHLNENLLLTGKSSNLNEIMDSLYSLNMLLDSLNVLSNEEVGTCLDLIESGKCYGANIIIRKSKPETEDKVSSLKRELGLPDVHNIEVLRSFKRLLKAIGSIGLEMLSKGKSVHLGATHYTKDVYPALRYWGINVHSTETAHMKPIIFDSKQIERLNKVEELIGMLG